MFVAMFLFQSQQRTFLLFVGFLTFFRINIGQTEINTDEIVYHVVIITRL